MKLKVTIFAIIPLFMFFLLQSCSKDSDVVEKVDTPSGPLPDVQEPTNDIPYSQIPSKEYIIELDRWDIPNDRTDPVKTTDNLQAAIDWAVSEGYGIIRLPAGHYLIGKYGHEIYQAGIELQSNMAFLLDKDAIIEMAPNDKWNYYTVAVTNKVNVVISGGTILGDRYEHIYTPRESDGNASHDEGISICIQGDSEYVTVENVTLARATGDGIALVGYVKHVDIRNNNMFDNRRQGVTIAGGKEVVIEDNEIHHTKGTPPQSGIDIEGGSNANIEIRSNYFHHNQGADFVNVNGRNVLFENNILEQGEGRGSYTDTPIVYKKDADLTIRNNEIIRLYKESNFAIGIVMYSWDGPKTNPATTYIYGNILHNCGVYMYKGADLNFHDNHLINGRMAFTEMENLTLNDNKVEYNDLYWSYRFEQVSGSASGNTLNGEPFDVPLSSEPWSN